LLKLILAKLRAALFALGLPLCLLACSHLPTLRTPASLTDEQDLNEKTQQFLKSDIELVSDPVHATQFLLHSQKTKRSVLIMHGLHESPAYMKTLARHYFSQGYNVVNLRLAGHQTKNPNDINTVKLKDWINSAEQGFQFAKSFGEEVELAGYSTGGTLSMYLALRYPDQVKKLVLIAPALALKHAVVISSLTFGFTGLDARKLCENIDAMNLACLGLKYSDKQIEPILREGLNVSPHAGLQVQGLIDHIAVLFGEEDRSPYTMGASLQGRQPKIVKVGYYQNLETVYSRLSVPVVLVDTANDNVVDWRFNQDWLRSHKGSSKVSLLFSKSQGVTHLTINKGEDDCFKKTPGVCNPHFAEILKTVSSLP